MRVRKLSRQILTQEGDSLVKIVSELLVIRRKVKTKTVDIHFLLVM